MDDIAPYASPTSAAASLRTLRELYALVDLLLELSPVLLTKTAPSVSGWSAEQHIAHLALANELVLRNLHSLVRGSGPLVAARGEPAPGAVELLALGRIPRGQAQSPRMVRPPADVQRELLRRWLDDARAGFDALDPHQIVPGALRVPHQLLGPLDAPQWARFAVVHTHHHLGIALEVLRSVEPQMTLPTLPAV